MTRLIIPALVALLVSGPAWGDKHSVSVLADSLGGIRWIVSHAVNF